MSEYILPKSICIKSNIESATVPTTRPWIIDQRTLSSMLLGECELGHQCFKKIFDKIDFIKDKEEEEKRKLYQSKLKEFKEALRRGDLDKIDRKLLIEIWEFAEERNLSKLKDQVVDVVEDYLEKIKEGELKIEINLDEVPNQLELLKEREGLSDKDIEIIKKLLMELIENELKKRNITVPDEVKEYLLNLQVCFYLKEEQVKEEIEKLEYKLKSSKIEDEDIVFYDKNSKPLMVIATEIYRA